MTSSVLEGIGAYRARKQAEEERRENASKPKVNRFNLESDGDSVVFRFVQEVDPDAKHYTEEAGLGFVNIEHKHPDPKQGWRNRANCTLDSQGACLPCEKVSNYEVDWNDRKGWKQKERLYINVVAGDPREVVEKSNGKENKRFFPTDIDTATGDGTVYLLEQSTWKGIWDALVDYAVDDETILTHYWKITKKGKNFNEISYTLTKKDKIPAKAKKSAEFELYDIKTDILKEIPYTQQDAFYSRGIEGAALASGNADSTPATGGGSDSGETW